MTATKRPIRVLLADDHVLVRVGLKRLIDDQPDMEVIAEAANGQEALRLAQHHAPTVALVDVSMPGWDGVTLTREMSRACPSLKIVAVTRHDDGGFVRRMMDAGACGYVLKQNATSHLVDAVRACADGASYVDSGVRSAPALTEPSKNHGRVATHQGGTLTPIDEQVLRLVATGASQHVIAQRLGMQPDDAARAKQTAMRNAGLTTLTQVIAYARNQGWLEMT